MPRADKPKEERASRKVAAPKKTKAKKDPNAPKKPLSAFMIFSQENRARIKDENPEATFGQIGKLLGAAWKDLNDEDRATYTSKQEKAKKQYENDVASYKEGGAAAESPSASESE
ncbi:Non-histone chromosomal protein 6 [Geranomyces michiganensis]|nr:Non-histone chromosomal protein 6 [Geranomyces michiganensis]